MEVIIGLTIGLVLGYALGYYGGREQFRKEVSENFIKSVEALNKVAKEKTETITLSTMN